MYLFVDRSILVLNNKFIVDVNMVVISFFLDVLYL